MRSYLLAALLAAPLAVAAALEARFATERITQQQWQAYFDEVSGQSIARPFYVSQPNLVGIQEFGQPPNQYILQYYFTAPGHSAHPAVVIRQMIPPRAANEPMRIEFLRGHFAGDASAFASWRKQIEDQTRTANEQNRREAEQGRVSRSPPPAQCRNYSGIWGVVADAGPRANFEIRQAGCNALEVRDLLRGREDKIEMNDLWDCKPGTDDELRCLKGRWLTATDFLVSQAHYEENCLTITETYNDGTDGIRFQWSTSCPGGQSSNDAGSGRVGRLPRQ